MLVDELDAGGFESPSDHVERGSAWLVGASLELAHRYDADGSLVRKVLLTPIEKSTRGAALFRCDHSSNMAEMIESINSIENRLTA